jgi:uracil-DNA glycosylase
MDKKQKLSQLNSQIRSCQQCSLAKTRKHTLSGEGNLDARLFLIAQAPGKVEDERGRMFIGPSGKVLNRLLDDTAVSRNEIYMTNLIKCHLPKNRKPKLEEIQACSHYLDQEINSINPEFLIPLGHYATRYILQKYSQKIPSKHDFFKLYGKLIYVHQQKIYPVQHPAALLHDGALQPVLEKNYHKLSIFLQPCIWASVCPIKYYERQGVIDKKWRALYCYGDWERCVRFQMEKQDKYHEDWMLPDGTFDEQLKNGNIKE